MSSRFPAASPSSRSILAGLLDFLIVHHVADMIRSNSFEGNQVDSELMTVASGGIQVPHRAHSGQACSVMSPKCAAILAEPKQPCCKSQVPPCCTCQKQTGSTYLKLFLISGHATSGRNMNSMAWCLLCSCQPSSAVRSIALMHTMTGSSCWKVMQVQTVVSKAG